MRIVFVLGSYLPKCSAVGNCVKNLVDVLEGDHEVTVVCQARHAGEPADERISGHRVVRVYTRLQNFRAAAEAAPDGLARRAELLAARCARAASIALPAGSVQPPVVRAYRAALEGLGFEPDLLVPTCLPFEACLACARYARGRGGVRLVPFLFDQFADSKTINRPALMARVKRGANLRLEREVFGRADGVLQITWEDHVRECHPGLAGKFVHVEHPLLVRSALSAEAPEPEGIVYAGALDPEVRDPAFALDVLSRALAGGGFGGARFYVPGHEKYSGYFEGVDPALAELLPPVDSAEIRGRLAGARWLLSIGNSTPSQKVSKVYEYMAYGKPIVHVASRADDEVAGELRRYPLACCLYEGDGAEACAEELHAFLRRTSGETVGFDEVAALFSEELPASVAEALIAAGGGAQ